MRLMRLSQAAENLQQRAVLDVALNKENEARELLMQKKKLIQALEKTKRRLEVLDELSMKINEAISLKETQLIGNVSLFPEIGREDTSPEIRIVSPKHKSDKDTMKTEISDLQHDKLCNEHNVDTVEHGSGISLNHDQDITIDARASDDMLNDLRAVSSYEDFMEDVDEQLMQVELDIYNFLRFSTMVLESKEKQMNTKVQQASEILEHIRKTRGRIASIMKRRENES